MKNKQKVSRFVFLLVACSLISGFLSSCREIRYLMRYPHPVLGAVETSDDWQEFNIPPMKFEKFDFLAASFTQGDRLVCKTGLSLFHLCSPTAEAEYRKVMDEYGEVLNERTDPYDPRFKSLEDKMKQIVEAEPLPDLEIELLTESGEIEKYETRFYGAGEKHKLPFDFHNCNQSSWNREKLEAGVSEQEAKYSYPELDTHDALCDQSHAKTFVKLRLRSPAGMKIEAIKIENNNSPFAIR